MEDILAVLLIFGTLPLIVFLITLFRYKTRARFAQMAETLSEKGQTVDQELLKSIAFPPRRKHADLRLGMILIAAGLGFVVLGGLIPDPEAQAPMVGLGSFPILIGIALLIYWFLVGRKSDIG